MRVPVSGRGSRVWLCCEYLNSPVCATRPRPSFRDFGRGDFGEQQHDVSLPKHSIFQGVLLIEALPHKVNLPGPLFETLTGGIGAKGEISPDFERSNRLRDMLTVYGEQLETRGQ
jgi:hypothetical protein